MNSKFSKKWQTGTFGFYEYYQRVRIEWPLGRTTMHIFRVQPTQSLNFHWCSTEIIVTYHSLKCNISNNMDDWLLSLWALTNKMSLTTSQNSVLFSKLIVTHMTRKFPVFYETSRFISVSKRVHHCPINLSQMNLVHTLLL